MRFLFVLSIAILFASCQETEIVQPSEFNREIHDKSVFLDPVETDVHFNYDIKGKWRTDSIINNVMIRENGHISRFKTLVDKRYDFISDDEVEYSNNGADFQTNYSYNGTFIMIADLNAGNDAIIIQMDADHILFCYDQSDRQNIKNELHFLTKLGK